MKKNKKNKNGIVYLVGAGPGDAGLLTLRGASLLAQADAIVFDWLVNPALLEFAPQAKKIYVGKTGNPRIKREHSVGAGLPRPVLGAEPAPLHTQGRINRILVRLAKQGKKVVRLKGGDPFVFGRGGEEASYLRKAGIAFEVVPGITAGIAAPAYAGIPVTDRRCASHVTFVTAHEQDASRGTARRAPTAATKIDWRKLATLGGTIVSFMGVKSLPRVVKSLREGGMPSSTLVGVIEWGTLPRQRVIQGTLGTIVPKVSRHGIESPAVTVIGDVNRFRKELAWYEKQPLRGKTVLVTRARAQASDLREALEERGARVLEFPALHILPAEDSRPLEQALAGLALFDWIVFTSVNAVEYVFRRLEGLRKDARLFSHTKIAVIGEATGEALLTRGLRADLVPDRFTSESLIEKLRAERQVIGRRFLLPRTDIAPDFLRKKLEALGAKVTEVVAYRTVSVKGEKKKLKAWIRQNEIDFITFASSSTVKNFFGALSKKERSKIKSKFVSIGPVTTGTLRGYGFKPYREASTHTIPGLVEAIK